jgi:tetratricopeptide (TPR) repeat protein
MMVFVGMLVLILGPPEGALAIESGDLPHPELFFAFNNRGNAHAARRDYDRAIRDYSDSARLDPDDPHALIGRGLVYCEKQEFDRAVRDFDAALSICPTCPRAISGRAAAYVGKDCR